MMRKRLRDSSLTPLLCVYLSLCQISLCMHQDLFGLLALFWRRPGDKASGATNIKKPFFFSWCHMNTHCTGFCLKAFSLQIKPEPIRSSICLHSLHYKPYTPHLENFVLLWCLYIVVFDYDSRRILARLLSWHLNCLLTVKGCIHIELYCTCVACLISLSTQNE